MSDNQMAGSPLPTPNYEETVRFLEVFHRPEDTWHLQAISAYRGTPVGRAFPPGPNRRALVVAWLAEHGTPRQTQEGLLGHNLYYHVNPIRPGAKLKAGKASKTDITEVRYLMVDCDPRVGEDVGPEQQRIRATFAKETVRPTFLVASGNGLQALYKLQEPIALPLGTEEEADRVALYNLGLAARLDGDRACKDISRVMRLPGTVNWPNAAKRKKGRVPALAALLEHNDVAHPLSVFSTEPEQPAPKNVEPSGPVVGSTAVALVPQAIATVDDLPSTVPDSVKRIIQHGDNPDDPSQFQGDRSKAVWHVTCELLRQRVPEEAILGVITNPSFGISAHVLEQPRPEKYALRQVAQARKEVGIVLPLLQLPQGARQHRELAADLAALLRAAGNYFNRGGYMTRLSPARRPEDVPPFVLVKKADAVTHFERVAMFGKFEKKELRPAVLTTPVAEVVLRAEELVHGLPEVETAVDCPVLLDAGSELRLVTGYNEAEKLFAHGPVPGEVPFEEAKQSLLGLLCDFKFVSPGDLSRAVAALYSPALVFGRFLGEARAPQTVMEADLSQAGKGFFCEIVARIYGARPFVIARKSSGNGVGSLSEAVASALIGGEVFLLLDNIRGKLDEPFIEAAQTARRIACRALRREAPVDVTRVIWDMTSNQAELTVDQANRSSFVRVLKQPDGYSWKEWPAGNLDQEVSSRQPYYLGCIHALLREWHRRGKPRMKGGGHDFHVWASVVRYINVEMLGLADPIEELRSIQARVRSPMENWARAIVLAVANARRRLGDTLRASDLLDVCVEEGLQVPGWREEDDNSTDERRRVALQMIGRFLSKVFSTARSDFRVDGWLMRRGSIMAPTPNDPRKTAFVYRVDPDTPLPPPWAPTMAQGSLPFGAEPNEDAPLSPPNPPCF
jgi:hypothetical protein